MSQPAAVRGRGRQGLAIIAAGGVFGSDFATDQAGNTRLPACRPSGTTR